jgi:hypothetical protein
VGLGGILVLGRAELTGGGCLLLELLLFLSVGEANLDRVLFTTDVDLVVIELLDDFLADRSGLETGEDCQLGINEENRRTTHRAKPTPRQVPFLSRRILAEQTL